MSTNVISTPRAGTNGRRFAVISLTLPLLALATTGCMEVGAGLYFLGVGSTKNVDAQFKIPEGPLLILVDDPEDLVQPSLAREALVDALAIKFKEHEVADQVTQNEEIARLRQYTPNYDDMSITEIGKRLNADTVLYLQVKSFHIDKEIELAANDAKFGVMLKVFDVHAESRRDRRLWPPERQGRLYSVELDSHDVRRKKSRDEVHRYLAAELADVIAKLFYDHKIEVN